MYRTFEASVRRAAQRIRKGKGKRKKIHAKRITRKQKTFLIDYHVKTIFVVVTVLFAYAVLWKLLIG